MFGMLDYRAHKLYLLLFGIPLFAIRWMITIGLPFLYYGIGHQVAENRLLQIVASVLSIFIIGIFVVISVTYIEKFFMFIFNLFVDVISTNERTKEESIFVVRSGEVAIKLIEVDKKHPRDWTDEDIAFYHRGFFAWFFKDAITHRFEMVRIYFIENPNIFFNQRSVREYLEKNNLKKSIFERLFTNQNYRASAIFYLITIALLVVNPWK